MNPFETHLIKHKAQLQKPEEPSEQLWMNIQAAMLTKQKNRKVYLGIAASVAIIIGAILLAVFSPQKENLALPLFAYSAEYGQVEQAFIEDIYYKTALIENLDGVDKTVVQSYWSGMEKLDAAYKNYKKVVEHNGCNETVMQLIIDNYRMKSDLLESLYNELTKVKSYEKFV